MEEKKKRKKGKFKISPFYYIDQVISKGKKIALNDSILIVGSPRSGTTWLMEIFENIPGYSYIFEPLQLKWFPSSRKVGFDSSGFIDTPIAGVQGRKAEYWVHRPGKKEVYCFKVGAGIGAGVGAGLSLLGAILCGSEGIKEYRLMRRMYE